jgi:hypothetical protein
LSNLFTKISILASLPFIVLRASGQHNPSQIGIGVGLGGLKTQTDFDSGSERSFDWNRTAFYKLQYIRPDKTFRGSAELYYQQYQVELKTYETFNEQTASHGQYQSNDYYSASFSAETQRLGLIASLNIRLIKPEREVRIYVKAGLGIEKSIKSEVHEDKYSKGHATYQVNYQTGVSSRTYSIDANSPTKATEAYNMSVNANTIIFNPAIRFHWKLNENFEMCSEIGSHVYANPFPGVVDDAYLIKTKYFGLALIYNIHR